MPVLDGDLLPPAALYAGAALPDMPQGEALHVGRALSCHTYVVYRITIVQKYDAKIL
jgi:hypothetical protein